MRDEPEAIYVIAEVYAGGMFIPRAYALKESAAERWIEQQDIHAQERLRAVRVPRIPPPEQIECLVEKPAAQVQDQQVTEKPDPERHVTDDCPF